MLCKGEELRRQDSAMRREEEDEEAAINRLKSVDSFMSRAELKKKLTRQITSLSAREKCSKNAGSVKKKKETVYWSDTSENLSESMSKSSAVAKPTIQADNF